MNSFAYTRYIMGWLSVDEYNAIAGELESDQISKTYAYGVRCIQNTPSRKSLTGLDEVTKQSNIKIYPNPCSNSVVYINLNNLDLQEVCVEIVNISGKILYKSTTNQGDCYINLNNFEKGVYLVKIAKENRIDVEKLIVR